MLVLRSDRGVAKLLNALKSNGSLRTLIVADGDVARASLSQFAELLAVNTSLTYFAFETSMRMMFPFTRVKRILITVTLCVSAPFPFVYLPSCLSLARPFHAELEVTASSRGLSLHPS